MDALTEEEWQQVKSAFDRAMAVPPSERGALIAATPLPAGLRAALANMVAAADRCGEFLEQPAAVFFESAAARTEERLQPDQRIGIYRVLGLLGSGGTGEVYLAERADGLYEQKVAVKRLRIEAAREWERFHAERQILARLDHPAIARLLDAGLDENGRPYTVVEYVQGRGFLEHCARLPLQQRLEMFLQICEAVAYAHTQLVIHRDIKPGNLMVSASGQVKLLDFGVAKLLDPASFPTGSQTLLAPFTPDYAAPEQIEGKPVSTATDVYALGVVLFELLTGRRPWSVREMPLALAVERLLHQPAPAASAAVTAHAGIPARRLAGDLDAIVAKSLRKEPMHRYLTVAALAEDLRRHLLGEPVVARAGARFYVAARFLRRHRLGIVAGTLAALALLGAASGYAVHRQRQAGLRLELAQRELRRGNAFNDFLSALFRSNPSGPGSTAGDPRQLLRGAAQRVFQQYQDRPSALGDVVLQLADLFIAADDTESAAPMLEQYVERFGAGADPADLAEARNKLATVAIRRGDTARAAGLLAQAQAFWNGDPQRYRDDLLSSRLNQSSIERDQGDIEAAIRTLRAALAERLRQPEGGETSLVLYQNLASALTAANHADEAAQVFAQGWAQFQAMGQTHTADALSFLGSWAVYAVNRGLLGEAGRRYRECVDLRRELYGESTQLAAALSGLGRVLALQGQVDEALPILHQARDMAARYAGPGSPVVVGSLLFEMDARLLANDQAAAEAALALARDAAGTQYGPGQVLGARLEEAEGRLRQAQGRYDEAERKLGTAEATFRKSGASAQAFLAQTLLSRGVLSLARGNAAAAVPPLQEAAALRARVAAPGTWLPADVNAALGEALIASGQQAQGLPMLRTAAGELQGELGARHPLTLRAQAWLEQVR